VYKTLARLLNDTQLEVRKTAQWGLLALFQGTHFLHDAKNRKKTIKRFMKLADTRHAGLRDQELRAAWDKRHAGALGLSAIVASFPYTMPEYLPPIVGFLARKAHDQHPVGPDLQQLFSAFKESHKDEWDRQKLMFAMEDLDAVNEVGFQATYFA
jgi:proteasome activator subunit 4